MKISIISGSPNTDGLTAKCVEQALQGAKDAGAEVNHILLNDYNIQRCQACDNGWGPCRDEHSCQVEDDFQEIHKQMEDMQGYVIITPVYWWDMSESTKAFIDRIRRCEASKAWSDKNSLFKDKPILCVAAAGGSGNGIISCLDTMEKFVGHVKGFKFDFVGVTQRNKEYKLVAIKDAAKSMVNSIS